MNSKLKDVQVNCNGEKFTNNTAGENIPDNVTSSGVHSDNNHGSENNRSSLQVLVKDDERDLIELMIASSTIPVAPTNSGSGVKAKSDRSSGGTGGSTRSDAKKRAKQQRDLSRDLALLFPDSSKIQEEKAFNFAQAYFLKVRDKLDENSFLEFLKVLSSFDNESVTVCDLYRKVITILEPYGELSEEFVAFLLPEQAMELGVYMEYLSFIKMRHFLRKLEVYFNKQPQQVRKIYECLAKLGDQSSADRTDMFAVRSVILPLLKGSSLLTEYFLQLFPFEQPSLLECSDNKDFEKIDCGEFDENNSTVLQEDADSWDWETVDIPDLEDPFGSDSCPCNCHSNSMSSASTHCFSCGIKFINGRVFVHSGKVLRPARLVIEGMNKKEIIERIGKKTALTNDDKGASSFKHRKRPASDSSPVKNSGGCNTAPNTSGGNPGILSPVGMELEEDISDSKPSSSKVKSPRSVRSGNILKINRSKTLNSKDSVKDNPFTTEDEIMSVRSSVLLDNLNCIDENKDSHSKGILCESINDVVVKKEIEDEDISDMPKCAGSVMPGSIIPVQSSRILIRDDEDDDIEYIEIDDEDADDDIAVALDDDDDDDIEEDEEEITQNDDDEEDYEDIEVVEIDDDEERDMDVDYLVENNKDDNRDVSSAGDKIDNFNENHKEKVKSDESFTTKSNFSECEGVVIKNEIPEEILTEEIKSEENECNDKSNKIEPKSCSVEPEEDKVPLSDISFININERTVDLLPHDMTLSVKSSDEESSSIALSHIPPPSSATTSLPSSWTKEEDKVILQTFQQEGDTDENFIMIRNQLPQRSLEEIKVRFNILMQLLKRMTTNKNSTE